jgi:predicted site-specific integrase-resolvase
METRISISVQREDLIRYIDYLQNDASNEVKKMLKDNTQHLDIAIPEQHEQFWKIATIAQKMLEANKQALTDALVRLQVLEGSLYPYNDPRYGTAESVAN